MNGPVAWFGAIGAIIASGLLAGDFGRRVSGAAFVLFMLVSVAWIVSGLASKTWPLVIQNAILLAIDSWGAWQFLLNPRARRIIERQEQLAEQAEKQVNLEDGQPIAGAR